LTRPLRASLILALCMTLGGEVLAGPAKKIAPEGLDDNGDLHGITVSKDLIPNVTYWEQAVASAPDDVTLHLALGNALALNKRFEEAIREYRKVLRLYPESKAAWNNIGSVYRALGKPADALGAYRKAIALDPRYGLAYYNMGAVYDSQGYYDEAIENYSLGIRYDPKLTDSRKNPQIVTNKRLYAVLLHNYVVTAGSLVLPLEPAYPNTQEKTEK
jgi:tetratricopeptide (TPR) repeat protein